MKLPLFLIVVMACDFIAAGHEHHNRLTLKQEDEIDARVYGNAWIYGDVSVVKPPQTEKRNEKIRTDG
jgi:hypothetical protein